MDKGKDEGSGEAQWTKGDVMGKKGTRWAKGMLMDMKKRVQPKAGHVPINLI